MNTFHDFEATLLSKAWPPSDDAVPYPCSLVALKEDDPQVLGKINKICQDVSTSSKVVYPEFALDVPGISIPRQDVARRDTKLAEQRQLGRCGRIAIFGR